MRKILLFIFSLSLLFPAYSALAMSNNPGDSNYSIIDGTFCQGTPLLSQINSTGAPGSGEKSCTWSDLINLINRIIDLLLYATIVIATITLVYAGFLMLTSGGNSGKVEQAKGMIGKVVLGFVFTFGAWLIVHFILTTLGVNPNYSMLQQK